MALKSYTCPNCGANYNPAQYQCEYCGSYVFVSNENYKDFSSIPIQLPPRPAEDTGHYPGVYVFGRLLGQGERPITLGAANYYTGIFSAGGKLLLTNRSLCFSAHSFNVGRQETRIDLTRISDVYVGADLLISQHLIVKADGKTHKFVVYHGNDWVQKIKEAITALQACAVPTAVPVTVSVAAPVAPATPAPQGDYVEELQKLKYLLDNGLITEEEYNIKKRMILGL